VSHTDELSLVHDIPLSTVHFFSCAFFASSTPALGSGTPLTWVASSTAMVAWYFECGLGRRFIEVQWVRDCLIDGDCMASEEWRDK